ncbi:phenylalanine--tRNA ligase subunit beta, partial [Candidatus Kapabacteria bacterium]|nr:phenylalanine--tRNA ligase subunit beta [Candidatus Kapabacteria bacterium]
MKLSYNWLKELTGTKSSPQELGEKLTMLGFELEEIKDYNKIYNGFITARVVKKEAHPDADKLSLCTVEYNGISQTVVCGAPNVDANQTIILGLEGAVVPSAGFSLSKRNIRGVESNGMICSKSELELGEDHSGIWVLPEDTPIGIPLAKFVELDDVMIDVFITPNRADGASHIGIAREICAKEGLKLNLPQTELQNIDSDNTDVKIEIENPDNCSRYSALVLSEVKVVDSPQWLKNRLKVIGLRPRNLIVDATNYVMMECGNPLHAFDLGKLASKEIIVKNATDNLKFKSLDEKDRLLDSEMLTINDKEKPIAIAGVMGGFNSEIDETTQSILIESAYFKPSIVRKTSRKLSLQSDSSYRYERGVDINNLKYAAKRCAGIILKYGGGKLSSNYIDCYPKKFTPKVIKVRYERTRKIIGIDIDNE